MTISPCFTRDTVRAGRVRNFALPQEYDLVRFTQDMHNIHHTWTVHNPACSWAQVVCTTPGEVAYVLWHEASLSGSPTWGSVPHTVTYLDLTMNRLSGPVEFASLPNQLRFLNLSKNEFSGPISLSGLPPFLSLIDLNRNKFSGEVLFHTLPLQLTCFDISWNSDLVGSVDFRAPLVIKKEWVEGTKIKVEKGK